MKSFFLKITAYTASALLILMAVGVGLFRLFLPRLPEYQEAIKEQASEAIGMEVEFLSMNARWGAADRVSVGISINSLVFDQEFVVDRILIRNTSIEIRQLEDGGWWVQGEVLGDLPQTLDAGRQAFGEKEFVAENVEIQFLQSGDQQPRTLDVRRALVSFDERRIAFDANIRLPGDLGRQATISATQLLGVPEERRSWDVTVEADDVLLAGWSALHPAIQDRVLSGNGDIDLSLVYADKRVNRATADADLKNISLVEGQIFDLAGRFELDTSFDGWLVAGSMGGW
jgi:uncharacterized protein YhdP